MNAPRKFNTLVISVLFTFLLFLIFSCDDFKSEEFNISEKDNQACAQLPDSIQDPNSDTLKIIAQPFKILKVNKALTAFDTSWVDSNVTENVSVILDTLTAKGLEVKVIPDTAYWLKTLAKEINSYFAFTPATGAVIFYLTESVDIILMTTDTSVVKPSNQNMPYETTSGCTVIINKKTEPLIKTRLEFSTPDEHYLLKLMKNDGTKSDSIKCSVLAM